MDEKVIECTDNASGSDMWRVVQVGVVKVSPHLLYIYILLYIIYYILYIIYYIYATQPPVTHHGLANGPMAHFSNCPHHKVIVQVFIMLHGTGAPPP